MKTLSTCLWFDKQAEEAAAFYATVFEHSKIGATVRYGPAAARQSGQPAGSVMTVQLTLEDQELLALNGGPLFKFTPALSFFVNCATEAEIDEKWKKLSAGGAVRMELQKYPWAEKYGWTADRFGVEWQLILMPSPRKIVPAFLFVEKLFGKGEEALSFYTSIFPNSKIEVIARDEATKTVQHCAFTLAGQGFALMEGAGTHGFTFNEATSLVVHCDTQDEIDRYWARLTDGGEPGPCGWLKDRYGVSWQVVPKELPKLLANPEKADRVMAAILTMKKVDLEALRRA